MTRAEFTRTAVGIALILIGAASLVAAISYWFVY